MAGRRSLAPPGDAPTVAGAALDPVSGNPVRTDRALTAVFDGAPTTSSRTTRASVSRPNRTSTRAPLRRRCRADRPRRRRDAERVRARDDPACVLAARRRELCHRARLRAMLPLLPTILGDVAGVATPAAVAWHTGALLGSYMLGLFVTAPLWGAVSDRIGGRRLLLSGCAATPPRSSPSPWRTRCSLHTAGASWRGDGRCGIAGRQHLDRKCA